MDLGLDGRVAMVACASSGLGLGVAKALAAEGADVSICARDAERLAQACGKLEAIGGGRVRGQVADVADTAAVRRWVADTAAEFGGVDIVVGHTGGVVQGPVEDFGPDDYRQAVDTALIPHVALVTAATPHLKRGGWGRVLLITSESVRQPMPHNVLSGVARMGVLGYARNLVHSFGDSGVTVNVLAPGYHDTPALRGPSGEDTAAAAAEVPVRKVGDPDDFGALVAFLAAKQAGFVTGALLLVDGGNTRAAV
ncbi:SDR family oxidoreductase [Saccharothrix coeruleofusca]|uniref:3-oxoacyl-ACP reductase n=1 Tax=Saccharothrix coeruleofusca TaxID=33919 RepID=A0A918AQ31_9PSEU|nr:SDR family oxidoreductase [Saccharothrix coeruleofusca]MBP2334913.1 3-oxoacyl-[acyl-carrier protein] reductase [Saccharothrix coeruleofusca]GGP67898.1 3-oxoacyl-ACP reductase [Saccharothrix coeruleofusca]